MEVHPIRKLLHGAALLAPLALTIPAFALSKLNAGWRKAYLDNASSLTAEQVAAAAGGKVLWQYPGPRFLIYVPSLESLSLPSGVTATPYSDDSMRFGGILVSPITGIPASVPAALRSPGYVPGTQGVYLLQFIGPVDASWMQALTDRGAIALNEAMHSGVGLRTVIATPEQIAQIRSLDFLQYAEELQPFQKGYSLPASADPDRWIRVEAVVAHVAGYEQVLSRYQQSRTQDEVSLVDGFFCVQYDGWTRIAREPLVYWANASESKVDLYGIVPAPARPGDWVTISGTGFEGSVSAVVGALPATVERTSTELLRLQIPPQISTGGYDVVVTRDDNYRQVLHGVRVDRTAGRRTLAKGDLILTGTDAAVLAGNEGQIVNPILRWQTPTGELRMRSLTFYSGATFFGALGYLNLASSAATKKYDAYLADAGEGPALLTNARAVVLSATDEAYIAAPNVLRRYSRDGVLLANLNLPGTILSMDLAADQCTLAYVNATTEGNVIGRFNVCNWVAVPTSQYAVTGPNAIRILPDETYLIASPQALVRAFPTGGTIKEITGIPGTDIALSPDGLKAYVISSTVNVFDVATNTVTALPRTAPSDAIRNGVVYGGWTAARGFATYADDPVIDRVTGFEAGAGARVTITGAHFLAGAKVTLGGNDVHANVNSTIITFTMPAGRLTNVDLIVTNPNGQSVTYTLPVGKRRSAGH